MASQAPGNNNTNTSNSNLVQKPTQIQATQHIKNNGSPLLFSSSQLFSSMPGLVAAAVAGITTLIPLNAQLQAQMDSTEVTNNNEINTTTTPAASSASPGTSTTIVQSLGNNSNSTNCPSTLGNQGILIANNNMYNNTGVLELVQCKLTSPYHVFNDPRLLDCGSSACFQCIMSAKDVESNLKCSYCNNVHNIPVDVNKITVNKNLQMFLKANLRQVNHIEESMVTLEQKIQDQNLTMENFDQYLTLVQKDVQMKVETMKTHLEKYGEQFIENLKIIRKEVQKQWIDHNSLFTTATNDNNNNEPKKINNVILQQHNMPNQQFILQQHQQLQQGTKDKTIQVTELKQEPLIQLNNSNPNFMTLLNNNSVNNLTFQLSSVNSVTIDELNNNQSNTTNSNTLISSQNISQHFNDKVHQTTNNHSVNESNNQRNILNQTKPSLTQHSDNLNRRVEGLQNIYNTSNNASWNSTETGDLGDFETDIALKATQSNQTYQKRHLNKEQAQFNKFVREEVSKKFGEDFLIQHEVNQLESSAMEIIRNEAIASLLPKETTPARAWTLAKVSLRSLKRDLRRKQMITTKKGNNALNHPYYDVQ